MSLDAMKQALEALNDCTYDEEGYCLNPDNVDAILALRAAIEQAQDPETELETYKRLYELRGKALERPCSNCGHQPAKIKAMAQPEQEPVAWVYQEGLEALKSGRPWTAYGSSGEGRIPLYLNDAVAPKAEPRLGGSGAGFESLPASPTTTWWDDPVPQMRREWQGLTDAERNQFKQWAHPDIIEAIELRLQERNT